MSVSAKVWKLLSHFFTAPVIEIGGSTDIRLNPRLVKQLDCKGKEAKIFVVKDKSLLSDLANSNILDGKDVLLLVFERESGEDE